MYILNKIVGWAVSPLGVGLALLAFGGLLAAAKGRWSRRLGIVALCVLFAWVWTWSTPAIQRVMGLSL